MKPKIFISHSTQDKEFIYKIANDLKSAYIDVWVDEWEIPVGSSIRKHIFEEGIPNCDLFFVYLSENSLKSYWVEKELDSATIFEAEKKHSFLATFIDKAENRSKLSLDLTALNVPEFNKDIYTIPLSKLISKAWEARLKKKSAEIIEKNKIIQLELENKALKLEAEIQALKLTGNISITTIIELLKNESIIIGEKKVTFMEIFKILKNNFAIGIDDRQLRSIIDKTFITTDPILDKVNNLMFYELKDIIGFFVINSIVKIKDETESKYESYYLTDLGIKVASNIL